MLAMRLFISLAYLSIFLHCICHGTCSILWNFKDVCYKLEIKMLVSLTTRLIFILYEVNTHAWLYAIALSSIFYNDSKYI
jgi:hypothetical protein